MGRGAVPRPWLCNRKPWRLPTEGSPEMPDVGDLHNLETPAALVDADRMEANLASAGAYCRQWKISYRPHTKTHKSSALALEQIRAGARGVTVATLREAEVMARVASDILFAFPPVGETRLARLMRLPEDVHLCVSLDSSSALQGLANAARTHGRQVGVLVEADVGLSRVGLGTPEEIRKLAAESSSTDGVCYRGILLYPGHIRMPAEDQEPAIRALSEKLADLLGGLEDDGLSPEVVSGGSTPTFFRSHQVFGVNEVRPGTGIFNDRTTALLGACDWIDCAYSVLATVVSTSIKDQAVVDAGSKSLAKEAVNGSFPDPSVAVGFGCVLDQPTLRVTALSEEHGVIDLRGSDWRPRTGDLVRILPNHVCVSVNLHERLWKVRGDQVLDCWEVEARGR